MAVAVLLGAAGLAQAEVNVMLASDAERDQLQAFCNPPVCKHRKAPLRPRLMGERASCIEPSPLGYHPDDEVKIEIGGGDAPLHQQHRFNGFQQKCADAVNVEVSVDGTWHNLGRIDLSPHEGYEVLYLMCSDCVGAPLSVQAFRACNDYTGFDCN